MSLDDDIASHEHELNRLRKVKAMAAEICRALEGEKIITYDHERDDGYCVPDPNCQCIACSCTCAACMARKQPP